MKIIRELKRLIRLEKLIREELIRVLLLKAYSKYINFVYNISYILQIVGDLLKNNNIINLKSALNLLVQVK